MNGFINVNKPRGMSSGRAVSIIKRKLGKIKVGHMGTLDPLAEGVLPIALGRANRLFEFLLQKQKIYIAEFTFGYETDTLDSEGVIVKEGGRVPKPAEIEAAVKNFVGEIMQTPPDFSAKNIQGRRAYDLARQGKCVEIEPCKVNVYEFKLIRQICENTFEFEITCGAGTYIRSLCRDLGRSLDTFSTMTRLVRTKSGIFELNDAVAPEEADESMVLETDYVLKGLPVLNISEKDEKTLLDGKTFNITVDRSAGGNYNGEYRVCVRGQLVGLGKVGSDGTVRIKTWLK